MVGYGTLVDATIIVESRAAAADVTTMVAADSAYRSVEREADLQRPGVCCAIAFERSNGPNALPPELEAIEPDDRVGACGAGGDDATNGTSRSCGRRTTGRGA